MITDITHPQFSIISLPKNDRLGPLFQLYGSIGKSITHEEFLSILCEWNDQFEIAKLKKSLN